MRQFVADASHELRTPVAVIRGEADVALTPPTSPDELAGAVEVIRDESRRLGRIVDDMFLLARADAHELRLAHEEVPDGLDQGTDSVVLQVVRVQALTE